MMNRGTVLTVVALALMICPGFVAWMLVIAYIAEVAYP